MSETIKQSTNFSLRIGKFDDRLGPICLNAKKNIYCDLVDKRCQGISCHLIVDTMGFEKEQVTFEEENRAYQVITVQILNPKGRDLYQKYNINIGFQKGIGKIREDILKSIKLEFEKLDFSLNIEDFKSRSDIFIENWSQNLQELKDITDIERFRREVEEITSANSIILKLDKEGNITYFNPFAERFFGYNSEEVIGKSCLGTIVPEKDAIGFDLRAKIRDLCNHPEKYEISSNENSKKDGTRVWIAWTNKPIVDLTGNFKELLCIGNDITNQIKIQQELVAEKGKAQLYFDIVNVMLLVLDQNGKIIKINKKGCEILGYPEEELINKDWVSNFIISKDKIWISDVLKGVLEGKYEFNENQVKTKKGIRTLFWHNAIIKDEQGNIAGIISSGEDLTELRNAEKELAKHKALKVLKDQMK